MRDAIFSTIVFALIVVLLLIVLIAVLVVILVVILIAVLVIHNVFPPCFLSAVFRFDSLPQFL